MVKSKKFACGERIQRFLMAFFILLVMALQGSGHFLIGLILLCFMAIMLVIYGLFDFCPSTYFLNKFLGSCYCQCNGSESSKTGTSTQN